METTIPDMFSEFALKVDQVLRSSADREKILDTLRSLAEGKSAVLPETEYNHYLVLENRLQQVRPLATRLLSPGC